MDIIINRANSKAQVKRFFPLVGNDSALVIWTLGEILTSKIKVTCGKFIVMIIKILLILIFIMKSPLILANDIEWKALDIDPVV